MPEFISHRFLKESGVIILILCGVGLFAIILHFANKYDQQEIEQDKECYKQLTAIIIRNPKQKANWIENTIIAQKPGLDQVSYCRVLELVKAAEQNHQSDKETEQPAISDSNKRMKGDE